VADQESEYFDDVDAGADEDEEFHAGSDESAPVEIVAAVADRHGHDVSLRLGRSGVKEKRCGWFGNEATWGIRGFF
jgi:hypothetical protein